MASSSEMDFQSAEMVQVVEAKTMKTVKTVTTRRVISDAHLMKSYTALKNAVEAINLDVDPENRSEKLDPIQCPSLVVTGTQSAGKTTFIETMVGFQIGVTARGTGTRCPVRYILRPTFNGQQAQYRVDNVDVENRLGLRDQVTRKMGALQKSGKFEETPIVCEISEPDVLDMDIIDLPGLKTADDPDQDQIVAIVSKYLRSNDVTPIVLTRAQQSPENQHDMQPLKDIGLRLDRSIVIVNGVNNTIRDIPSIQEINNYFHEYMNCDMFKDCKSIIFSMFHPTLASNLDKEGMKPWEVEEFYKHLPTAELTDLDSFLNSSFVKGGDAGDLDSSIRDRFGVYQSHKALLEELESWTKANGSKTAQALENRMPPLRASQRKIQEQIQKQTDSLKNLDSNVKIYADKYLHAMRCIRQDETFELHAPAHDSSFNGLIHPLNEVPRERLALRYEEEVRDLGSILKDNQSALMPSEDRERPVWKSPTDLAQLLKNSKTGKSMGFRLTCEASVRRLVKLVSFQVMMRKMRPFTEEEIESKHRVLLLGGADATGVIKQLVGDQIRTVFQEVFPRLLEHIRFLCERPMGLTHSALAKGFLDVGQLFDLHTALNHTFTSWLDETLVACNSHLVAMMEEKMTTFPVDIDSRLIMLMRLSPMRDNLDLLPGLVPEAKMQIQVSHKTLQYAIKEQVPPEAKMQMQVSPGQTLQDPDGMLGSDDASEVVVRRAQPVRSTNLLSSEAHGAYKDTDVYKAYLQVRETTRESHETSVPEVIQFVEGGLTGIPTAEYREMSTLVNEIGEKFFVQVKGLLVMEMESKIEMYVLEPLSHKKGSDDDLHLRIRDTATEFVKDEENMKKLRESLGIASLEDHLVKKKDRVMKIEKALRTLRSNLHGGMQSKL